MRRTLIASTALMALAGAGAFAASSVEPQEAGPGRRDTHKPSGNKPVAGGGAKERARRAARINSTTEE